MNIIATDLDGSEHILAGRERWTMMEILRDAGLAVRAECGGACACATCHVYVDAAWLPRLPPRSELETEMLDTTTAYRPTSRLSCQLQCDEDLDGVRLTVAPE